MPEPGRVSSATVLTDCIDSGTVTVMTDNSVDIARADLAREIEGLAHYPALSAEFGQRMYQTPYGEVIDLQVYVDHFLRDLDQPTTCALAELLRRKGMTA